jgi:hypothetical protein
MNVNAKKVRGREQEMTEPLVSAQRDRANPRIDMVNLMSNQEESRVTRVNLNIYKPYKRPPQHQRPPSAIETMRR